ncbi:MAG: hypothetical protein QOH59_1587 [Gemmatimonadales bacterium]|jgi:hypothetical protein|nr:hypothetical protein [Gemmatimonadales bacterium]
MSLPGTVGAQSSQFGARGLGYPGRALAVRAIGTGGAFGLVDPESSQNPAALASVQNLTAVFTITQGFRSVENPAGTASLRDTRFPQVMVAGGVRPLPLVVGLSFSNYTTRDFSLASSETIDLRGVPVNVSDTFSSRGGLNDFRIAGSYRLGTQWAVGGGFHIISGSNRLTSTRIFEDSTYLSSRQRSELSYTGVGISVGVTRQFGPNFAVSAMARSDGHVNMDRDSARVGTVDLPYSAGLGLHWRPSPKLDLAGQALFRTWSGANSDLLALGGTGAQNTVEAAVGAEYTPDPRRPTRRPIRFGAHYSTLPFPLVPGEQGREFGVSAGSGLRFAQQRAGLDVALEHVWRSEGVYSENGFILSLGILVRP